MAQQYEIGKHCTSVINEAGYTKVIYHNTIVVKFNYEEIVLNSDGWRTATTKTRMNQASNQFNLGFGVYQKNYDWYIEFQGKTVKYQDNIVLKR